MKHASAEERAEILEGLRARFARQAEVVFAYVHGSFIGGGPYRDIDIAVWLDPARTGQEAWGRYGIELSAELTAALGEPVDVRVLNDAPLAFRYHALNGEPLVVHDREWLDELRARTWDDYFDFLPFARQYIRELAGE